MSVAHVFQVDGCGELTGYTPQFRDPETGVWWTAEKRPAYPHGHHESAVGACTRHREMREDLEKGAPGQFPPVRYRILKNTITTEVDGDEWDVA